MLSISTGVAPRYGNNDDLRRLFDEAHKRQMRVVLDLVAGHSSDQSPWFRYSQQKEQNPYTDRYIWDKWFNDLSSQIHNRTLRT